MLERDGTVDRQHLDIKDRADRALRAGNAAEALPLYSALMRNVRMVEKGVYEGWIEGAAAAYRTLGRNREAGYALLALRRFAEAERCFVPERDPHEWALCAASQGRPREASRVLAAAGHTALAAMAVEASGDWTAARQLWEAVLVEDRLRRRPYESALVGFNLGHTLRRLGDAEGARRIMATTQTRLEELADDFETRGAHDRAFDCYMVLIRIGQETGSFENVSEGYLNVIRLVTEAYRAEAVLQYHEDFLELAASCHEWHAAALLAQDAADFSLRMGLAYERHYRQRAASLWNEAARYNAAAGGAPELSENALVAAVDAAASAGDLAGVGRLYGALAELPLPAARRERYAGLARRYRNAGTESLPAGQPFPEHFRLKHAYTDVWRQDLVEWELGGQPRPVLVQVLADRLQVITLERQAIRALLMCADERFSLADPTSAAELALALGEVQAYPILRTLEPLASHPSPRVRAAAMIAAAKIPHERSFTILRQGLADSDEGVRLETRRALRAIRFRNALQPLVRLFRDTADEAVRHTIVEAVADIGLREAGIFLIDVVRSESGPVAELAARRLRSFPAADLAPLVRQILEVERPHVRAALAPLLAATGSGGS